MRHPSLFAVFLTCLLCRAAHTQEPAAIATVRSAPGFRTAAESQFQHFESTLSKHCATVLPDWAAATHRVYGQPQTDAEGKLTNATWTELVPGTACGQARLYHALVLIRGGKASIVPLLPGDGYAGPQLQHDALLPLAGALGTVGVDLKQCPMEVVNTHLTGSEPSPTPPRQPWTELWTVQTCNKRLSVPMQFIPDASGPGTSIHIASKGIVAMP